ncbi:MAG: hypothetical protein HY718_20810, partial [Planctomycetes bacterium]|nr:hypothetical protein [Planctomycetota bacterium]
LKMGGNIPIHVPPDPVNNPNGQDSLNGLTCNTRDGNYAIGFTKLPVGGGDYQTYAMVFDRTASWNSGEIPMSAPSWSASIMPAYNPITNTYFYAYGTTSCMGREVSPASAPLGVAETLNAGGVRFPALAVRPNDGRFLLAKAGDNGSYTLQLFSVGVDTTPPGAVAAFSATPGSMVNLLNWTNPSDIDFTGTVIRYRTDGQFPADVNDGQWLVDQPGAAGSNGAFVHEVQDSRVTYHYAAFAHDAAPNYAAGVHTSASPYAAGDFDFDDDVDQVDFGHQQMCFTATFSPIGAGCEDADLDHDFDVDEGDVTIFQACMRGAGAMPGC